MGQFVDESNKRLIYLIKEPGPLSQLRDRGPGSFISYSRNLDDMILTHVVLWFMKIKDAH